MTDKHKETSQDREQAAVEQGDARRTPDEPVPKGQEEPVQEIATLADAGIESMQEESSICHSRAGGNPENLRPVTDSGLCESNVNETDVEPAVAPSREGEAPDSAEAPLTQGERDVDRVIGILLGESQETTEAVDEQTQEVQATGQVQEPPAEAQPQEQETAQPPELVPTVESVLEAILFATDEPLTDSKLAGIVETTSKQVRESIENLNVKYTAAGHAFRVEQIAGGYQMLTLNTYNQWLKKMLRARSDNKLNPAAMETLAIIAYKQPIIRADIEAIRGVAVGEVIRSLMYKGLVKIIGRAEILGRPMLYGTTKKFLEIFGLNSLKDLPKAEELKNPDRG